MSPAAKSGITGPVGALNGGYGKSLGRSGLSEIGIGASAVGIRIGVGIEIGYCGLPGTGIGGSGEGIGIDCATGSGMRTEG